MKHGLRTPREAIAFTARPKIRSHSQIFRYGGSIFSLPHRPNFSDIFDLCCHWVSVVRVYKLSKTSATMVSKVKILILKTNTYKRHEKFGAGKITKHFKKHLRQLAVQCGRLVQEMSHAKEQLRVTFTLDPIT